MRFTALFPLACAIVAFVLSMLCLFAGHKPGFMEDYDIIRLNTSTLGHDLIPTSTTSETKPTSTSSGIGSFFSNLAKNVSTTLENELDDILDDVADKLAAELGIKQWYSLHLMDMCEGTYTPNATAKGAKLNISRCTNATAMHHFDLTDMINKELEDGPLGINISFIDWPEDIQKGLDALSIAFDATFILYAIGIAAAGLAIIASFIAFFLHGSRLLSFGNWGLASLSFLALLIASIIITVLQNKSSSIINKYGNDIGIYAEKGTKYLILTWVSVATMFLAATAWVVEFFMGRRKVEREYTEKKHTGSGRKGWRMGRGRMSDEGELRSRGV